MVVPPDGNGIKLLQEVDSNNVWLGIHLIPA